MGSTSRSALFLALALTLLAGPVSAQVQTFRKEVKQVMGTAQSQDDARAAALAKARHDAVNEAGLWLESQSEVQNFKLEKDQVTTLATGITQVKVVEEGPYLENGVVGFRVVAEVRVDNSGLAERVKQFLADRKQMELARSANDRESALLAKLGELERQIADVKSASDRDRVALRDAVQANARQLSAREWFEKGYALYDDKRGHSDSKKAIEDYSQAIRLDPEFSDAYFLRATANEELRKYDQAVQDYDQFLRIRPKLAVGYLRRGYAYYSIGLDARIRGVQHSGDSNIKRAILDFDRTLRLDPNNAEAYYGRADAYQKIDEANNAIQDYDKVIAMNPETDGIFRKRGEAWADLRQFERAIQDFDQHLRRRPDDDLALLGRGDAYLELGRYQRAIDDYDQAVRAIPSEFREHDEENLSIRRGRAYLGLGQYKLAIQSFDRAYSNFSRSYYRGVAYAALGRHQRAIQDFNDSIDMLQAYDRARLDQAGSARLDSFLGTSYHARGKALFALGQKGRASADWKKACQLGEKAACEAVGKN